MTLTSRAIAAPGRPDPVGGTRPAGRGLEAAVEDQVRRARVLRGLGDGGGLRAAGRGRQPVDAARLAADVKVILTPPCVFCIDNR